MESTVFDQKAGSNDLHLFHQKIHPELNLEKWNIFVPTSSRLNYTEVIRKRQLTLKDGSKAEVKVSVQKVGNLGVLTTQDKKTCCALQKLWEDSGKPTTPVSFSCRKLAKILDKSWGVNTAKAIMNSLTRLRTVPMIWDGAFFNAEINETEDLLTAFNILSELKIVTRKKDGHVTKEGGYFRFNDYILKNLYANHTKPLYLDVILGFKTDIAQLLYTHIDLILSKTNPYTRKTAALFEDLGLEGKTYCHPSARKRKLEKAIAELHEIPLSSGILEEIRIEKTKSGKDYKVTFRKRPYSAKEQKQVDDPVQEPNDRSALTPQAEHMLKYFHQKLSRPHHQPTQKELAQAARLLESHGEDATRYLIDYALKEAQKTHFDMQVFGAILQYTDEALRAYEQEQQVRERYHTQQEQIQASIQQDVKEEQRLRAELDRMYASLSDRQQEDIERVVAQRLQEKNLSADSSSSLFYEPLVRAMRYTVLREMAAGEM